jgi:ADP-ribose pyrophosphatase YjhB (NUDIX family)
MTFSFSPLNHRLPIRVIGYTVGSVLPDDAALYPLSIGTPQLNSIELPIDLDERNTVLAQWATALYDAGRLNTWRNELISVAPLPAPDAVLTDLPPGLAEIERGAVRVLGIFTHAVHLVGESLDGRVWLQKRALTKATDPGLWDSLAGGLLSISDGLESGVLRETYEEAGLTVHDFSHFSACGMVQEYRKTADGYIAQAVWAHRAILLPGVKPRNLDGEVTEFACVTRKELQQYIVNKQVSYEAILAFKLAGIIDNL